MVLAIRLVNRVNSASVSGRARPVVAIAISRSRKK